MKQILLFITVQLVALFSAFSMPITQEEADSIVLERLSQELPPYTLYAKEDVQTKMTITTINGEMLELDYRCWVYYIRNINTGRYLIVKEENGSLLQVNPKSNAEPDDLTEWRIVKMETCNVDNPLTDLPWLKEYHERLIEAPDFSSIKIDLYKVIGKDEYVIKIYHTHRLYGSDFDIYGYGLDSEWRNYCSGKIIYHVPYPGMLPSPELQERIDEFLKSIEFVSELFYHVVPPCGATDPLQDIEWLKEYCESINENQDISFAYIDLCNSREGYVFQIVTLSSSGFSAVLKNCAGEKLDVLGDYNLRFISEIFRFIKQ